MTLQCWVMMLIRVVDLPGAAAEGQSIFNQGSSQHSQLTLMTYAAAVLGKMLVLCAYHPSALLKTTSALMGLSVEKECKLDVMRFAGFELITLLRVSGWALVCVCVCVCITADERACLVSRGTSSHLHPQRVTNHTHTCAHRAARTSV